MSAVRTASIPPPASAAASPVEPAAAAPRTRPVRPVRRPPRAPVYLATAALFAGFSALFCARMVAGEDPALGLTVRPLAAVVPATPTVRKVIVTRRIRIDGLTRRQIRRRGVDRIVIVHRRAPAAATTLASSQGSGSTVPALAGGPAGSAASPAPRRSTSGTATPDTPGDVPTSSPSPVPTSSAPTGAPPAATPVTQSTQAPSPSPAPAPTPAPVATTTS